MRAKVSKTVKTLYGMNWRKKVRHLVRSALGGSEGVTGECFTRCCIKVNITLSKEGATVTAQPDFLPELEECELRVET
jgi:hypothetical protein